jgi:hypothetical protein
MNKSKSMKKILYFAFLLLISGITKAQLINVNPDPKGESWIAGGLRVPSENEINKIPLLKFDASKSTKDLPTSLDNSTQIYFRPVFNQTNGCCAQASGVGYNFTYEMNLARGTAANTTSNQFPTHFTYDFINGGGDNGSFYTDGWDIIKVAGCPTVSDYGGLTHGTYTYWMSGYDLYKNALNNKCVDYFAIDVSTPTGLLTLKQWMKDHLEGDPVGGLANFSAGVSDIFTMDYTTNIISTWGTSVNHAMTFVGWDDNISYDFNGDGNITNDIDINGDGIVDMRDWEKGALIMVNSWGTSFGNNGKAYVPYKLLAEPSSNGGIQSGKVYVIKVSPTYTPKLTMKVSMTHSNRSTLKITAGVSSDLSSTVPQYTMQFPVFNNQGGAFPMNGSTITTFDFTLDITPLLSYINSGTTNRFFLNITENDPAGTATGSVNDFSVVDQSNTETVSSQHNVTISNNTTTRLYVDAGVSFDSPEITTSELPVALDEYSYSTNLEASGGTAPYKWNIKFDYPESSHSSTFPNITTGILTTTDPDDGLAVLNLPFNFPFYGKTYNKVWVSTDGSILFQDGFSYLRNESAIISNKMIAVFASDLMSYPADGDGIFYSGDATGATIHWKTSLYGDEPANLDFAVKIFPSGEIQFFYNSGLTTGLDWASGISAGDGLNYTIASNSGISDPSNMQFKFTAAPYPIGMELSTDGVFSGTPQTIGSWNINFAVSDFDNITKTKTLEFNSVPTGINTVNTVSDVSVFPNPATDKVSIILNSNDLQKTTIEIFDAVGKKINQLNCEVSSTKHIVKWNCTNSEGTKVPEGIYFIKISNSNHSVSHKIMITK